MLLVRALVALLFLVGVALAANTTCVTQQNIFQFGTTTLQGNNITFSQFRGKVLLIANTASFWGMTVINYLGYNQLMTKFPQMIVFGFPSPQFMNQEPARNDEVLNCLKYVRPGNNYVPEFYLSEKIDVNGADVHPLFAFLKGVCPQPGATIPRFPITPSWSPVTPNDITWNFEKFLIDKNGIPYKRYEPTDPPLSLVNDIALLLAR